MGDGLGLFADFPLFFRHGGNVEPGLVGSTQAVVSPIEKITARLGETFKPGEKGVYGSDQVLHQLVHLADGIFQNLMQILQGKLRVVLFGSGKGSEERQLFTHLTFECLTDEEKLDRPQAETGQQAGDKENRSKNRRAKEQGGKNGEKSAGDYAEDMIEIKDFSEVVKTGLSGASHVAPLLPGKALFT